MNGCVVDRLVLLASASTGFTEITTSSRDDELCIFAKRVLDKENLWILLCGQNQFCGSAIWSKPVVISNVYDSDISCLS